MPDCLAFQKLRGEEGIALAFPDGELFRDGFERPASALEAAAIPPPPTFSRMQRCEMAWPAMSTEPSAAGYAVYNEILASIDVLLGEFNT